MDVTKSLIFPDHVVGVRNMREGRCHVASTHKNPDGSMKKQALGPRGSRTDNGIVPYSEWENMVRAGDVGIGEGLLVRDDGIVPKEGYTIGPKDETEENPNVVIDEGQVLKLGAKTFAKRVKDIDSSVVVDRLLLRAQEMKEAGDSSAYEKIDILETQAQILQALEAGMPDHLVEATHSELMRYAEENEIPISREAQRLKTPMMQAIIASFVNG